MNPYRPQTKYPSVNAVSSTQSPYWTKPSSTLYHSQQNNNVSKDSFVKSVGGKGFHMAQVRTPSLLSLQAVKSQSSFSLRATEIGIETAHTTQRDSKPRQESIIGNVPEVSKKNRGSSEPPKAVQGSSKFKPTVIGKSGNNILLDIIKQANTEQSSLGTIRPDLVAQSYFQNQVAISPIGSKHKDSNFLTLSIDPQGQGQDVNQMKQRKSKKDQANISLSSSSVLTEESKILQHFEKPTISQQQSPFEIMRLIDQQLTKNTKLVKGLEGIEISNQPFNSSQNPQTQVALTQTEQLGPKQLEQHIADFLKNHKQGNTDLVKVSARSQDRRIFSSPHEKASPNQKNILINLEQMALSKPPKPPQKVSRQNSQDKESNYETVVSYKTTVLQNDENIISTKPFELNEKVKELQKQKSGILNITKDNLEVGACQAYIQHPANIELSPSGGLEQLQSNLHTNTEQSSPEKLTSEIILHYQVMDQKQSTQKVDSQINEAEIIQNFDLHEVEEEESHQLSVAPDQHSRQLAVEKPSQEQQLIKYESVAPNIHVGSWIGSSNAIIQAQQVENSPLTIQSAKTQPQSLPNNSSIKPYSSRSWESSEQIQVKESRKESKNTLSEGPQIPAPERLQSNPQSLTKTTDSNYQSVEFQNKQRQLGIYRYQITCIYPKNSATLQNNKLIFQVLSSPQKILSQVSLSVKQEQEFSPSKRKSKLRRVRSVGKKQKKEYEFIKKNEQRITRLENCFFEAVASKPISAVSPNQIDNLGQQAGQKFQKSQSQYQSPQPHVMFIQQMKSNKHKQVYQNLSIPSINIGENLSGLDYFAIDETPKEHYQDRIQEMSKAKQSGLCDNYKLMTQQSNSALYQCKQQLLAPVEDFKTNYIESPIIMDHVAIIDDGFDFEVEGRNNRYLTTYLQRDNTSDQNSVHKIVSEMSSPKNSSQKKNNYGLYKNPTIKNSKHKKQSSKEFSKHLEIAQQVVTNLKMQRDDLRCSYGHRKTPSAQFEIIPQNYDSSQGSIQPQSLRAPSANSLQPQRLNSNMSSCKSFAMTENQNFIDKNKTLKNRKVKKVDPYFEFKRALNKNLDNMPSLKASPEIQPDDQINLYQKTIEQVQQKLSDMNRFLKK